MLRTLSAFVLLFACTTLAAEDAKPVPLDETSFVAMAGQGGMLEVQLGKIATTSAQRAEVRAFGELMVKDHGKGGEWLQEAARAAGIAVPDKLDEKHALKLAKFRTYKGDNFDRDYIADMITDHTNDLVLFTRASKELKNKEIRDFATNMIPVVRGHLDQAKKLNK